jgi:hypothetical protein
MPLADVTISIPAKRTLCSGGHAPYTVGKWDERGWQVIENAITNCSGLSQCSVKGFGGIDLGTSISGLISLSAAA